MSALSFRYGLARCPRTPLGLCSSFSRSTHRHRRVQQYHESSRLSASRDHRPILHCIPQQLGLKGPFAARTQTTHSKRGGGATRFPTQFASKCFTFTGSAVIATGAAIVMFFLYDSFTYRRNSTAQDVAVPISALEPRRGGPKNLPILDYLVGEYDNEEMAKQSDKPRLVILGTGWGSTSLLKNLKPGDYHVTVISPTNSFLYTPMLPSATMGTVSFRSIAEPIRRTVKRLHGHFLNATADDVNFSERLVEVSRTDENGELRQFYIPYDKLVIAVGRFIGLTPEISC